ncbi:MAG: efflux RND transporter periplasmic adaptor subunit [Flavobacteriales bacterium]
MKNIKIANVFLIIVTLLLFSCSKEKKETVEPVQPVKYVEIKTSNLVGYYTYSGLAKAQEEAALSFRVSGTINKRLAKVGDRVKKGQILITLDPTDFKVNYTQSSASEKSSLAQIKNAEANLKSSEANYIVAKSNYARYEKLYETNSVSLNEFEQSKANYEATLSSYNAAKAQVVAARAQASASGSATQSAGNQVSYTRLKAPFDGIISAVNAEQNEAVSQGNTVMVLSSEKNPEIEVGIPEIGIAQIKKDQEVAVRFSVIPDKVFAGKVFEVGYSSSGSTYTVTIRLVESDDRIRPGMPADVTFEFTDNLSAKSAIVVPPGAVGEDDQGNYVYLLNKTDEKNKVIVKRIPIKVGSLTDKGFEVKEGLQAGQIVAAAGLNVLRDGIVVKLFQESE